MKKGIGRLRYDEFGRLENPEEGTTKGILFAYTGYGYEKSTGLYDAKARHYDAETGRFLSEDQYYGTPMEPANQNRYIYVRNNPLKYTDPSGNVVLVDDMVILVFIVAGAAVSYIVTVGYLKTEKGKLLLNNAKKVIYDGTTYLKDKFKKIISGIGEQVKKGVEAFDQACKELIDLFTGASKRSDTKKKKGSKENSGIQRYQEKALSARDAEVTRIRALSRTQRDKYTTVAAGYNKKTGQIAVAAKVGQKGIKTYCVEDLVAGQLFAFGAKLEDIVMTPAIRPRNMVIIPVCKDCQKKYSRDNFIPGTPFL